MLTLIVPPGVPVQQIDDFPEEGCSRSRKGSLHIRPASSMQVTEEEWEHMRKAHAKLAGVLIVARPGPTLDQRRKMLKKGTKPAKKAAVTSTRESIATAPRLALLKGRLACSRPISARARRYVSISPTKRTLDAGWS